MPGAGEPPLTRAPPLSAGAQRRRFSVSRSQPGGRRRASPRATSRCGMRFCSRSIPRWPTRGRSTRCPWSIPMAARPSGNRRTLCLRRGGRGDGGDPQSDFALRPRIQARALERKDGRASRRRRASASRKAPHEHCHKYTTWRSLCSRDAAFPDASAVCAHADRKARRSGAAQRRECGVGAVHAWAGTWAPTSTRCRIFPATENCTEEFAPVQSYSGRRGAVLASIKSSRSSDTACCSTSRG